jgi:hypothetical protein
MMIRTYEMDYTYVALDRQNSEQPMVGIECIGPENQGVNFYVQDDPLSFAGALEGIAKAIRKRYGDV